MALTVTTKRCSRCRQVKPIDAFPPQNPYCRPCRIRYVSKGGEHSYMNTQITHPTCNRRKQAKMPGEVR